MNRETSIIETVAGLGPIGDSDEERAALEINMTAPSDIAFDKNGDLLIADRGGPRIKLFGSATDTLSTIAGAGSGFFSTFSGDGEISKGSGLETPESVIVSPSGDVILADSGHERVRSIDPNNQVIQTIVGTTRGFAGDGGSAINCKLTYIDDLALDQIGNLYILDGGTIFYGNHRIRRVDAVTGIISTIVGNGDRGFSGDDGPPLLASIRAKSIAISPSGDLYIADTENHRIRIVRGVTSDRDL